jgi:hypothetical protein
MRSFHAQHLTVFDDRDLRFHGFISLKIGDRIGSIVQFGAEHLTLAHLRVINDEVPSLHVRRAGSSRIASVNSEGSTMKSVESINGAMYNGPWSITGAGEG